MTALNDTWLFASKTENDPSVCKDRMDALEIQLFAINQKRTNGPIVSRETLSTMLVTDVRNVGLQLVSNLTCFRNTQPRSKLTCTKRATDARAIQLTQQYENQRKERENRNVAGEKFLLRALREHIADFSKKGEDKAIRGEMEDVKHEITRAVALSRIHNIKKTCEDLADIRVDPNIMGTYAVIERKRN